MSDLFGDPSETIGSATLSPCRTYRYLLTRVWDDRPACVFIGLNPSTADEKTDDLTITKCIGFAKQWDCGQLRMLNLFAYRDTDPAKMLMQRHPIGPECDEYLDRFTADAKIVVAAWGMHGGLQRRDAVVVDRLRERGVVLMCLGMTKEGFPRHPSRLAYATALEKFTS
jgi:hypothetical protein